MIDRSTNIFTALALAGILFAGCGGAAVAVATPTPTPTPTAAATLAPTATPAAASSAAWTVTSASKATVSVREQLVGVDVPSDAVLTATGATGTFQLKDDGAFTADSKISFDMSTLQSGQGARDNFIKQSTLAVRQFPTAELVPVKATGLTLPLPANGDFTFTLSGKMTIHGVTKDVTCTVQAKRTGGDLVVTATAAPTWKFGDFGMTPPSLPFRVVSIVDEIRLVVTLVATGPKT